MARFCDTGQGRPATRICPAGPFCYRSEMKLPQHLPALDGLRGVAILMVVLTHAAGGRQAALSIVRDSNAVASGFVLPHWLAAVSTDAIYGVPLFFAISAFTLTLRAGADRGGLAAYALRRIARVGPGYWLAGLAWRVIERPAIRWAARQVSARAAMAAV